MAGKRAVRDPAWLAERVTVTPAGCWEWTRYRTPGGYGMYGVRQSGQVTTAYAHRLSHELHIGPIPQGYDVCHTCDNPPCCNPAHIFAGTRKQNMEDCVEKGRIGTAAAKLTPALAREIRDLAATGATAATLAARFAVSDHSIRNVIAGRTWAGA